ncbi:CPA_1a_G0016570.mRNA.1.CDS.1 [Saccharomyces cerevisiae]|nr:Rgd2p [Saccharomyces cerevisiae YJM1399]CAI4428981.1 CPA_1a_G0016570.mRNA.1.CDS.1 [Saccharomyces cerevisiae]CAI4441540.1 BBM_1a_G0016580.mRNA.1.CDS.1 [Saccharomyces cerevisiae]CAI4441993.1 ADE_G0016410.mRNA.1.CDS.1 [Saccharomyces cerevisiae]CAI6637725.1 ADE_G0016410.mRNA.1.CDS.1 [Saccharomyces cerevisiae]
MLSFCDYFWSEDLVSGLDVLFDRLYHGCEQCDLFIQLFASRMQFEVSHGRQLFGIEAGMDNLKAVQEDEDEGVTVSRALRGILQEMSQEGTHHLTIASNIESLVLQPFSKWCIEHRERIQYSEKTLLTNVNNFRKSKKYVSKLEKEYFNKCRQLEEFKRTHFNEDELANAMKSLKIQNKYEEDVAREKDHRFFNRIAGIDFDYKTMKETLQLLLTKLPKTDYKLPLISYSLSNTNNGGEITKFLLDHMSLKDIDQAETFGQDLLNLGFLKYCNGVGNTFVNSKKFQYQWKNTAYMFANVPMPGSEEPITGESLISRFNNWDGSSAKEIIQSKIGNDQGAAKIQAPHISDNERTLFRMMDALAASDKKYYQECFKMDALRCSVEELLIDHLSFMEKCESDRLKAIKKATLDFCSTLGNKISSLKLCIDKMLTLENDIDPTADLLQLLVKYKTGSFKPQAIVYNNYYNPGSFQNFGVDLETRCRLDKKVVPLIISSIFSYMDKIYPDLPNDKVRTSIWTDSVKLSLTHQLRNLLNKQQFHNEGEIFDILSTSKLEPSTIASVVKIYLLELPDPLIPNDVSDILRVLYLDYPPLVETALQNSTSSPENQQDDDNEEGFDTKRIRGLYTTLSSLSKPHIATLDAITTHFYRLIKILKMGENGNEVADEFTVSISQEFANCIIQSKITDDNEIGFKIFYDLLTHKKQIFHELKRQNSKN